MTWTTLFLLIAILLLLVRASGRAIPKVNVDAGWLAAAFLVAAFLLRGAVIF